MENNNHIGTEMEETRKIEKVTFAFSNPGTVEIEVPVMTSPETQRKFVHPDDVDEVLDKLDSEYELMHKKLHNQ